MVPALIGFGIACWIYIVHPPAAIEFYRKLPRWPKSMGMILVVVAALAAFFADLVDVSGLFRDNSVQHRLHMTNLVDGLRRVATTEEDFKALHNLAQTVFADVEPVVESNSRILFAVIAGMLSAAYLVLIAMDHVGTAGLSEDVANAKLELEKERKQSSELLVKEREKSSELMSEKGSLTNVINQVETVVISKCRRIERALVDHAGTEATSAEEKLNLLKEVLSPAAQIQAIVDCVHAFFFRPTEGGLVMRITVFQENGRILQPMVSTDGKSPNVVRLHAGDEDFFRTNVPPRSVAVHAFHSRKPIIIPDCSKDARYAILQGGSNVASMFAVCLSFKAEEPIAVLVADANRVDSFKDTPEFQRLLAQLCRQIAVRFYFEHQIHKLLSKP